ncbi:MAG: extracellular solute-binding protein, partial [Candidatus Dadabacteria bacterium]
MAFGSVRNRVWIGLSAVFFVLCSQLLAENQISLQGAGATFPYPLYSRWAYEYNGLSGVKVNYQSIGSGGGIAQIKARTVDFGASDAPLKKEELDAAGLVQFPMVVGGVVVVVNLEGIGAGDIKLSSSALAKIFLGEITNWSDPEILKDNPGIK